MKSYRLGIVIIAEGTGVLLCVMPHDQKMDVSSVTQQHDSLPKVTEIHAQKHGEMVTTRTYRTLPRSTSPAMTMPIGAVQERQQLFDFLQTCQSEDVFELVRQLSSNQNDVRRLNLVMFALEAKLSASPADAQSTYQYMAAALAEFGGNETLKRCCLTVLGEVSTPEALQVLLDSVRNLQDGALKNQALQAIAALGDKRPDMRFRTELSPLYEAEWKASLVGNDARKLQALAAGLAKTGTPEGVGLLLGEIQKTGDVPLTADNAAATVAAGALRDLRNPEAIPVLDTALVSGETQRMRDAAGYAFSCMGNQKASEVLLKWAVAAGDEGAPVVKEWFSRLRDDGSIQALKKSLADGTAFRSQAVKDEILRAVAINEPHVD